MRIELHFQYTINDLRDALTPERRSKRRIKSSPRWQVITILVFAIPITCAGLYLNWTGRGPVTHSAEFLPPVRDLLFLLGASAAPALAVIGALSISLRRSARLLRRSRKPEEAAARPKVSFLLAAAFNAATALGTLLVLLPNATIPWEPPRVIAVLIGVGPWALAWIFLMVLNGVNRSRAVEIHWNMMPVLRRAKVLVLDDDEGHFMRDELSATTCRWPYFPRARETEMSLLLHDEEGRVHIIPKRAFADEVELARARGIIERHVKSVSFLPQRSGFPVVMMPQQATTTGD
jgi:hypothetical protein